MRARTIANALRAYVNKILDTEIRFGFCGFGERVVIETVVRSGTSWDTNTGRRIEAGLITITVPISTVSTMAIGNRGPLWAELDEWVEKASAAAGPDAS